MTSAEAKCGHCKGTIGEDITGRPMCYDCGPVEMIPPIVASHRRQQFTYGGFVFAGPMPQQVVCDGIEATGDGGIRAVGYVQARRFTREEVLTVLRTLKADTGVVAGKEALDRAIRVFESMEVAR